MMSVVGQTTNTPLCPLLTPTMRIRIIFIFTNYENPHNTYLLQLWESTHLSLSSPLSFMHYAFFLWPTSWPRSRIQCFMGMCIIWCTCFYEKTDSIFSYFAGGLWPTIFHLEGWHIFIKWLILQMEYGKLNVIAGYIWVSIQEEEAVISTKMDLHDK